MAPNMLLRNSPETGTDVTLARLMRNLQAHFEERNAPDLYGQLTSISKLSQESTCQFVILVYYSLFGNETEGHYCF